MKYILLALVGASLVTGCSSGYVLTLNNGSQIRSTNKPVLKQGAYVYKDAKGKDVFIPAGRVAEVAPASMVKQSNFNASSAPSSKR
jgi:hypothetical protein